ncbi:copper-binding protein [Kosakonia sp.]|uniref:copper-binding protein n=1 Tax=Kosakonia sp. TaxID=1916651 RepID=UPI002896AB0A|nr:copper-binding protein [Kosakonia sp.]
MRSYVLYALAGAMLFSFSAAQAQTPHDMHGTHDMSQHNVMPIDVYQSQGVVKKITPQSISIAHQSVPALNWPPMTMQFSLAEGKVLPVVQPGDNVSFTFMQSENGYQLVSLTPQQ